MELYNVDEFANHHGSKRAVPESQIKDNVSIYNIYSSSLTFDIIIHSF